jgi:UDP-2,3-diacylglucosamine pyrophosphatase LpxH
MLAIVSDLHFCDGTACDKNVKAAAFDIALREIYDLAAPIVARDGKAHIDLVFLGDTFDLIRTERWFEDADQTPVSPAERPWASAGALDRDFKLPESVIVRARAILDAIIDVNKDALDIITRAAPPGVEVRRILLTGNHDRLALHDDLLHARMRTALGAADERTLAAEGIYPHRLEMKDYGLLARHGHEWDKWNFEAFDPQVTDPAVYTDADYRACPIGDPITTELAARLPYLMRQRLTAGGVLTPADVDLVYRRLQRIEDVRPLFASLHWIYYEASRLDGELDTSKSAAVRAAAHDVVQQVCREFRALAFFQAWLDKHHRKFRLDAPEQLSTVLNALSWMSPDTLDHLEPVLDRVLGKDDEDDNRVGAAQEQLGVVGTAGARFVVYGHTHDPEQAALSADADKQATYLNSGTFRRRVFRTDDKKGFIDSEHLTYLCFYSEAEAATWRDPVEKVTGPSFAAWMGARSR